MDIIYQYTLVKSSREALLEYCQRISDADFVRENSSFGIGSVRNLLVHIGNTYEAWIGKRMLGLEMQFTPYDAVPSPVTAKDYFDKIDSMMSRFITTYEGRLMEEMTISVKKQPMIVTPFKLFTHVITHEFHHKGQILSLSRHLGYVPVDTDIMR